MKVFTKDLVQQFLDVFRHKHLRYHLLAILLTYVCVATELDWWYFQRIKGDFTHVLAIPALVLGGILPIIVPVLLLVIGKFHHRKMYFNSGVVLAQAAILGSFISSLYKAFTGRIQPDIYAVTDISHNFQFGFLRHGVFWGWPSSHTTIAFAMSVALISLFPHKRWVKWLALFYAFYVGIGVSTGAHWFSEFLAGAIIGSIIGIAVGSYHTAKREVLI
ncbi:MAG: phosphatase PAP2 family protein [Patescibacteria group bacterium]